MKTSLIRNICFIHALSLMVSCAEDPNIGTTIITKWQGNKNAAISITFDDGIINQFTIAKPIMDSLGFPGTFYVITGKIKGSGSGKFIGRDPKKIIEETASIQTNKENFFERASLIAFTGTSEAADYHAKVGSLFEQGRIEEAYDLLDEGYQKIRNKSIKNNFEVVFHNNPEDTTSWEQLKTYAAQGHEIASHTVTHPRLAVLDEVNLRYELEQSKADLLRFLGPESTFSAEGPYGTENERALSFAHQVYPSLRNRMPEPWLEEINRGSKMNPAESQKEYVQWQRGPLSSVHLDEMKGWVDTSIKQANTWLVLVFHGIDNLGWEPKTRLELKEYFEFLKKKEDQLWIATFRDVTKYLRQRKSAKIQMEKKDGFIFVTISSTLDPALYNVPLTVKTYVPNHWNSVAIVKGKESELSKVERDENGSFVLYSYRLGDPSISLSSGDSGKF